MKLSDGSVRRMNELAVGDEVVSGNGQLTKVYGFSHALEDTYNLFVKLHTANGTLVATDSHHVYTTNGVLAAGKVTAGDSLVLADGSPAMVFRVSWEALRGLYNPHTLDGRVVVDGFQVTTFTAAVETCAARALLAPFRTLFVSGMQKEVLLRVLQRGGLFRAQRVWSQWSS